MGQKALRPQKIVSFVVFPLFIAAVLIVVLIFRQQIWQVFSSSENIKEAVESWGIAAPLSFIGLQFIQVVIFVIPGEVPQIAGGYLFGTVQGSLLSVTGILLGSSFNFLLARVFGVPFVRALFGEQRLEKFDAISRSPRSQIAFFLLFVIPGIPKDILCYVAGLSPMRYLAFVFVSMIGRLPGIVGSAGIGGAAAANKWVVAGIILGVASVLFALGVIFRNRLQGVVERLVMREPPSKEDESEE
ncbi:MAG: TVP38/TMEM64 family protein [Spirochaetales bacterium]|nr:TVP38/TMEM64 family protein [Spirochaetales bacterium]